MILILETYIHIYIYIHIVFMYDCFGKPIFPTWLQQPRCRRGRFGPILRLAPGPAQATEALQVGVAQRHLDGYMMDILDYIISYHIISYHIIFDSILILFSFLYHII